MSNRKLATGRATLEDLHKRTTHIALALSDYLAASEFPGNPATHESMFAGATEDDMIDSLANALATLDMIVGAIHRALGYAPQPEAAFVTSQVGQTR